MHIKTTIRYYFTLVRMAIISKSTNKWRWGFGRKGCCLAPCWWDCKLVQSLWKTVWKLLKKLKTELPYGSAIPFLGIYPKKLRMVIQKWYMHLCVHWSIIYYCQNREATQVPISRKLDRKEVVHIYNEILLGPKEQIFLPLWQRGWT